MGCQIEYENTKFESLYSLVNNWGERKLKSLSQGAKYPSYTSTYTGRLISFMVKKMFGPKYIALDFLWQ